MINPTSKILFLTAELPYPPISGGKLKSWKLLEFLSQNYSVAVAAILKEEDESYVNEFLSKLEMSDFFSAVVKRPRNLLNLFKSYLQGIPLNLYRTYTKNFAKIIKQRIEEYDLVICDHYEVFQYISHNYKGKVILHEHNAYYLMWQRYAEDSNHTIGKRLVSYCEAQRVIYFEKKACTRADLIFASPNDIDTLENIGVDRKKCKYTYHLGDDSQLLLAPLEYKKTNKSLLYIGSLTWEANVDGLLWFIEYVWSTLIFLHPDLTFNIVGKNPDPRLLQIAATCKGISFTGFVQDLEPYFQQHRIFIAPIRFGAGMKVKVLNAMCRGIPTVTTSVGCEGMDVKHLQHLIIADDAEDMAQLIDGLLCDQQSWEILEQQSRQLIKSKYTWKALFTNMKFEIDNVMKQPELIT
ncbi:MAG: glycosyltransferase family 4 protein [Pseudomonadota bacterium]